MSEQRNKQEYGKLREMKVSDQFGGLVQTIPNVNSLVFIIVLWLYKMITGECG